jgi:glycerol-3-phosphate acyltransferase PlsX
MRIVVDAMGGDLAPASVVEGAVCAAKQFDVEIILVGQKDLVDLELAKFAPLPRGLTVQHAQEVVRMDEAATVAVRKKKDSSITKAVELLKHRQADALVSAGNTGAVVCASTLYLGILSGVERPGIAITIPTLDGESVLIDAGANIDPKPAHLLQYAIMADTYIKSVLEKDNPRVGLLNIGEEETKGTGFLKETYSLLEQAKINFIGNIEGKDINSGECDCIVCDGFVGNVALKVSEGLVHVILEFIKREVAKSALGKLGAVFLKKGLSSFRKDMDYAEYGGAPLLGVDGVVIIGHGHSSANAIKNAIRVAIQEVRNDVNKKITEALRGQ